MSQQMKPHQNRPVHRGTALPKQAFNKSPLPKGTPDRERSGRPDRRVSIPSPTTAIPGPKMSSTSTSVAHSTPPVPLTLEALLYLVPMDATPESMQSLDLSGRNITTLPAQMKVFQGIRKMLLVNNSLSSIDHLGSLKHLAHLNLSNNALSSLEGLAPLKNLVVLQASSNRLTSLTGVEGSRDSLKALIVNDNKLTLWSKTSAGAVASPLATLLESLSVIETIVLSRNPLLAGYVPPVIEDDAAEEAQGEEQSGPSPSPPNAKVVFHPLDVFAALPKLRKLSLSECNIPSLPRRWFLPFAVEVRLAQNQISSFPEGVILRSVHTLDVSSNSLPNLTELRRCKYLQNLSVRGNTFAPSTSTSAAPSSSATPPALWWSDHKIHMIVGRMFEQLRVLDGVKFVALSKEEYLAKKSDRVALSAKKVEGEVAAETDPSEESEVSIHKRPREVVQDVVLELPEEAVAASATTRNVVRRQRAVAEQHIARNTKAVGAAALELLKQRQSHPTGGW